MQMEDNRMRENHRQWGRGRGGGGLQTDDAGADPGVVWPSSPLK